MGPRALSLTAGAALVAGALCSGCGAVPHPASHPNANTVTDRALATLVREARPIGHAPRFHPAARGPLIGACRRRLGARYGVHVELFAADRVVLLASGIGTRPPRRRSEGRITSAGCYGALATLEPTGVVLVSPGTALTLSAVFRSWGQPLSAHRLASFRTAPGHPLEVFLDGHRWVGAPGAVPLRRHAEIVVEAGPHVPPHSHYTFPPGT
ncbi:MAG: hypothetical protein QOF83_2019 [Solirubrobacteraceae bacterium]|nr:hypothetical protein [Solirubrobacteraceae bacterium]